MINNKTLLVGLLRMGVLTGALYVAEHFGLRGDFVGAFLFTLMTHR